MDALDQDRRTDQRITFPSDWNIHILKPVPIQIIDGVNVSNRGVCLRVGCRFEINARVDLQMRQTVNAPAEKPISALKCSGRVAWVVQRLDLRDTPPFLFDVGIEWLSPPPGLRRLLGGEENQTAALKHPKVKKSLAGWQHNGRDFTPRLTHEENRNPSWHLVVIADGAPCLSERFESEKAALEALKRFKKAQQDNHPGV